MAESFAYCRPPRKCRDVSAATKAIESKLVREPCVASTISGPCRAPAPVPPPICVDACDCQARSSEMKNRWPNAALFVSLTHGWHPVPPFPACAAVCFVNFHTRQRRQPFAPPALAGYAHDRRTRPSEMKKNAGRTRLHLLVCVIAGPSTTTRHTLSRVFLRALHAAAPPAACPALAHRLSPERVSLCPRRP